MLSRQINDAGLALIKSYEKCLLTPYLDEGGIPTIGWGHTKDVTMQSPSITQAQADSLLQTDIQEFCDLVTEECDAVLTDNQFAAIVSLCYNVGTGPLKGKMNAFLEAKNYSAAADDFLAWDKVHIDGQLEESAGLENRRKAEKALFLSET